MSTPQEPFPIDPSNCVANLSSTLGDEWVDLNHCDNCLALEAVPRSPAPHCSEGGSYTAGADVLEDTLSDSGLVDSNRDVSRDFRIACKTYQNLRQTEFRQRNRATHLLTLLTDALLQKSYELSLDSSEIEAWQRQLHSQLNLHDTCLDSIERQEQQLASLERQIASQLDAMPIYGQSSMGGDSACDLHHDSLPDIPDLPTGTPPSVEELFRLEGQQFVFTERLEDLELEHQFQLDQLDSGDAQHSNLHTSYGSREKAYHRKHRTLVKSLAVMHCQTEDQRATCISQGFDPERFRYRSLSGRFAFD